jgi:hypothetical protein
VPTEGNDAGSGAAFQQGIRIASMRMRHVYLIFCALGFLLPYSQLVPWVREHGLDLSLFVSDLFANRIGAFFGLDVLVSAIVLVFFARREGRRLGMRDLWMPVIAVLAVGVSLGLPLFLYQRQAHLDRSAV